MASRPLPRDEPATLEIVLGLIVLVGLLLFLAASIDALGDLVKDEVRAWIGGDYPPIHSRLAAGLLILLCLGALFLLLGAMEKFVVAVRFKPLDRIGIILALLLAPLLDWKNPIGKFLENLIDLISSFWS